MSNNIYDILKKMAGLETPKQTLTEGKKAKPDYIDIDQDGNKKEPMKRAAKDKAKGGMAEAVARVEKNLSEKYMGFKKLAEERKEIPVSVIDGPGGYEEAQKRIQDHEASKVKRQELPGKELPPIENRSRPAEKSKAKAVDESGLQAYLGKKKYGETGMRALQKAGREGAGKEKMAMIRAKHDKMDEDAYNEDMLSPKQKKIASMSGDPDKIDADDFAALRGQKKGKKTEGNKFSGNLMKARAQGLKRADLDGDGAMEPVRGGKKTEGSLDPNLKTPNIDKQTGYMRKGYELDSGAMAAADADARGQEKYKSRTEPGIINKVKDTFGLDKPDSAYGPKETTPMKEGHKSMREGWEEMQKYLDKKKGPESKGGEGKKSGTRYGGSAQQDDSEDTDGEGQPTVKKKGRPKGTGGGAKFSFKKPKD